MADSEYEEYEEDAAEILDFLDDMRDISEGIDDDEVDAMFVGIMEGARDVDFGLNSEVYLLDGTSLVMYGLDPIRLASVLGARGVAALEDKAGRTVVVFAHGVAAIIGTVGDEDDE